MGTEDYTEPEAPEAADATEVTDDDLKLPAAFVRQPRPHVTQAPIDNLAEDEEESSIDYGHESGYTSRSHNPFEGSGYRRSRRDAKTFTKDLKYGSYLEVPKGKRDLFTSSRQQKRNAMISRVATVCVVVVLVALIWFFFLRG
jgi:hypothetical protein